MRVISKKPLREFWERHPESKTLMLAWFRKISDTTASTFVELRREFSAVDYVDGFTVFDVGGNHFRIAAVIHYNEQRLYVRQVMRHAEYDRNAWRKR